VWTVAPAQRLVHGEQHGTIEGPRRHRIGRRMFWSMWLPVPIALDDQQLIPQSEATAYWRSGPK
jgi:hypothetical protein